MHVRLGLRLGAERSVRAMKKKKENEIKHEKLCIKTRRESHHDVIVYGLWDIVWLRGTERRGDLKRS